MRTFERGDVIKVPFPYTDRATRQSRPAVVVSTAQLQELHGLLWVVMITSAENRGWPDDVPVANPHRDPPFFFVTPKFQFVANGLYEAPFGINVAANLLIRQGYGQPYYQEIEAPARDPYALKDVLLVPDVGDNRLQLKLAGLPVPSLIRSAKIATIDASDASKLGRVAAAQLRRVTSKIRQRLGAA